jgi:hypothetical protein
MSEKKEYTYTTEDINYLLYIPVWMIAHRSAILLK